MINGDIKEFLDKLYCGEELLFEYDEVEYFIQGWFEEGKAHLVLDRYSDKSFEGYYWECVRGNMKECAEEFLNANLWNGKTLTDIQDNVIWKE